MSRMMYRDTALRARRELRGYKVQQAMCIAEEMEAK